jgi:hypothetical protein
MVSSAVIYSFFDKEDLIAKMPLLIAIMGYQSGNPPTKLLV